MQLSRPLAQQIRDRTRAILNQDVLITDPNGMVITGKNYEGRQIEEAARACTSRGSTSSRLDGKTVVWFPFVYETEIVGAFGLIEELDKVTPDIMSLLQGLAEVIVYQNLLIDKLQPTSVLKGSFIKSLLEDNTMSADTAYRQADILHLNLHLPLVAMLIAVEGFEPAALQNDERFSRDQRALLLASQIEELTRKVQAGLSLSNQIMVYVGLNTFALLVPVANHSVNPVSLGNQVVKQAAQIFDQLTAVLPERKLTLGVGQYYPDLGGLRKSYQEAALALDVGLKVWGPGQVYPIKKVGMFVSLTSINQERKAELAHQLLHSLLNDDQLYKTVRTFLDAGLNLSEAAETLHIHRNTLIYRLNKTKKLIHLDPRHFEDALQIKLGLMFYQ